MVICYGVIQAWISLRWLVWVMLYILRMDPLLSIPLAEIPIHVLVASCFEYCNFFSYLNWNLYFEKINFYHYSFWPAPLIGSLQQLLLLFYILQEFFILTSKHFHGLIQFSLFYPGHSPSPTVFIPPILLPSIWTKFPHYFNNFTCSHCLKYRIPLLNTYVIKLSSFLQIPAWQSILGFRLIPSFLIATNP